MKIMLCNMSLSLEYRKINFEGYVEPVCELLWIQGNQWKKWGLGFVVLQSTAKSFLVYSVSTYLFLAPKQAKIRNQNILKQLSLTPERDAMFRS